MARSRLSLALRGGHLLLPPEGRIAVFRPKSAADLAGLPTERVHIIHGFRPAFDAIVAAGFECATKPAGKYAAAIVFVPRSKAQAKALIAQAVEVTGGGPVIVDGQKSDGIDSIFKALHAEGADTGARFAKAHGSVFSVMSGDLGHWRAGDTTTDDGFVTRPGMFSADAIDPGSALLAGALPGDIGGTVADLGAGWGYLAARLLQSPAVQACHLIEAEYEALRAARKNITDVRAQFHWADATRFTEVDGFDHVVTNPPFHTGRAGDPSLGQAFISAAARLLHARGTLWLVANRHLPYEATLEQHFTDRCELAGTPAFKLLRASRPRR